MKKTIIFLLSISWIAISTSYTQNVDSNESQNKIIHKNQIGIDASEVTSIFKKGNYLHPLNFSRSIANGTMSVRLGFDIAFLFSESNERYYDVRLGLDKSRQINVRWNIYYGLDLSYYFKNYQGRSEEVTRFGLSPLMGIRYQIMPNLSLSTESKLHAFYYKYKGSGFIDSNNNINELSIVTGSVGSIMVNFHF